MEQYKIPATGNNAKIHLTGTIQKHQLQKQLQNTSYREQCKILVTGIIQNTSCDTKYQLQGTIQNTSYREQYKSTTNRNNTNISATQYKIPVTGKYTKYQLQGTM